MLFLVPVIEVKIILLAARVSCFNTEHNRTPLFPGQNFRLQTLDVILYVFRVALHSLKELEVLWLCSHGTSQIKMFVEKAVCRAHTCLA